MTTSAHVFYEIQQSQMHDAVWIHASDGSTVGRFGKMGVDLHNTISEQLNGAPQCRLCTHVKASKLDWDLFREKALEWWNVEVPINAFNHKLFM
jgi:hypothetical protein